MKTYQNFNKIHTFFVGIGGISMSGLAKLIKNLGGRVSGSDRNIDALDYMKELGITIYKGHDSSHITSDIDLVIYSSAIKKDNPELMKASVLNIPMLERHEFLGMLSKNYKEVIAVSGSHGKTTVTSMLGYIFYVAKLNPTIHIGGESVNFNNNTIIGGDDYLILEGCEYRDSFLSIIPSTAIILSTELDHTDYFKDYNSLINSFQKFADKCKFLVKNKESEVIHNNSEIVYNDWCVKDIKITTNGYKYKVYYKNKFYTKITLNVIGKHNITNSLFAIAVAHYYKIPKKYIRLAFKSFSGVKRRYEKIGKYNNIPVYIDYAHHATEIIKSIAGLKERYSKVLVIFQPHTYSRTKDLFDDFRNALSFDDVIIYKTYPAREKYIKEGSSYTLYQKLNNKHKFYAKDLKGLQNILSKITKEDNYDCIVILGAGDLAEKFVRLINSV